MHLSPQAAFYIFFHAARASTTHMFLVPWRKVWHDQPLQRLMLADCLCATSWKRNRTNAVQMISSMNTTHLYLTSLFTQELCCMHCQPPYPQRLGGRLMYQQMCTTGRSFSASWASWAITRTKTQTTTNYQVRKCTAKIFLQFFVLSEMQQMAGNVQKFNLWRTVCVNWKFTWDHQWTHAK